MQSLLKKPKPEKYREIKNSVFCCKIESDKGLLSSFQLKVAYSFTTFYIFVLSLSLNHLIFNIYSDLGSVWNTVYGIF